MSTPNLSSHSTDASYWNALRSGPLRVGVIGSGNWGSAIVKIIGMNCAKKFFFEPEVRFWVHEEKINGKNLTDIINSEHENVRYLPGIKLPDNIRAIPDLRKCVEECHILVFVMPHQFIKSVVDTISGHVNKHAKAITLIKGFDCEGGEIHLMSKHISSHLGIECSSLSGANVAMGVAREEFSETTIGYASLESARLFQELFDTEWFKVNAVPDVAGVELCGALKNVVALAAGFVDGLGMGENTKAAVLRIGFNEMRRFCALYDPSTSEEVFGDSSGLADLLTTSYGGRNRACAMEFTRAKGKKSWDQIEKEMLNGQKLQGVQTARDVNAYLVGKNQRKNFPLFSIVYDICDRNVDPNMVIKQFMTKSTRPIVTTRTPIKAML